MKRRSSSRESLTARSPASRLRFDAAERSARSRSRSATRNDLVDQP
ncbi:hypothetical protein ACFPRL_08920 [Pseudoclavibacter helvolus]